MDKYETLDDNGYPPPGVSPRVRFILSAVFIVVALAAVIIGLTLGLRTPAPANGGSPTGPPSIGDPSTSQSSGEKEYDSASRNFRSAAVQTDTHLCSTMGRNILAQGGSAVDAAIVTDLCVGVVNAHSNGIGGGFFMTLYQAPRGSDVKEVNTIISRERAPLAATRDMYVNDTQSSTRGGKAVGVPGEVAGLYKAWELYGRLEWSELVLPIAKILEEGFQVEEALAYAISSKASSIEKYPNLKEIFYKNNEPMKVGDLLIDKPLAATFRRIAADPMSFYNGSLADDIAADLQEAGGIITREDLGLYEARVRAPLVANMTNLNLTLYTATLPTSGVVLQFILRLVDGINFGPYDMHNVDDEVLIYHRWTEILKFAYAKRSGLADEDYYDVSELKLNMTSEANVEYVINRINDTHTQDVPYYGPAFEFSNHGTAHMSIVAPDGSTVALTSTINQYFGSLVRGNRTGIIFNNEMDDFSTPGTSNGFGVPASPSNYIEPHKMPMSSMAPVIILDDQGEMRFVSGASGGTMITSSIAYVALQELYLQRDLKEATDMPRIHHQLVPNVLRHENGFEPEVLAGLEAKGHELQATNAIGRVGSIANTCRQECSGSDCFTRSCINAVSDGRKGGAPDGF